MAQKPALTETDGEANHWLIHEILNYPPRLNDEYYLKMHPIKFKWKLKITWKKFFQKMLYFFGDC